MIRKLSSGQYRLYSRKRNPKTGRRRNLGTFRTRRAAEAHERAIQYFKSRGWSIYNRLPLLRPGGRGTPALTLYAVTAAGCASTLSGPSITTTTPNGTSEQIPVELSRPDGPGPFPAVVIMHDCSGLRPRSSGAPGRWAKELVGRGYVVIMPDSFSTRGFPDGVCTDASRSRDDVSPARRVRDA